MNSKEPHCVYDIPTWRTCRQAIPKDKTIGFVPTMGNLHAGHASLLKRSALENDISVLSIFINPSQFNQIEDLKQYPRTITQDIEIAKDNHVDYIIIPTEQAMYPDKFTYQLQCAHAYAQTMEGKHRPGHFTGVLTIVMKLLQLTKPDRAYFGEKDHQQFTLAQGLVDAFFLDTTIVVCDTIRDKKNLPLSSRNNRLNPQQRNIADQFSTVMQHNSDEKQIKLALAKLPLNIEYVITDQQRIYVAVTIDDIRLIDNKLIKEPYAHSHIEV